MVLAIGKKEKMPLRYKYFELVLAEFKNPVYVCVRY
jgi:hypothetical protein